MQVATSGSSFTLVVWTLQQAQEQTHFACHGHGANPATKYVLYVRLSINTADYAGSID